MTATDLPEFIATHGPGIRGAVYRRCAGDTCYTSYAETPDASTAKDLARRLNATVKAIA